MKYGLVSINTARQVKAAHTKTTVNAARRISYLSKKAHSTVKRPIHKNTTFKNSNFNQRVNTVKDKNVNIVRPKSVVKGNNVNAVKASAYWVWKPKTNVLDYDQRVIDSRCSRHMTGNMSYLTDYKEIDGGYVAFGGNPKGGKITGKCTIKIEDAKVVDCLPNATIFEQLALMESSHDDESKPLSDGRKKVNEDLRKESECNDQEKEDNVNITNNVNVASTNEVNAIDMKMIVQRQNMNNLDTTIQVSHILTTRIHKDHPLDQVIEDFQSATQTRRMSKSLEEHGKNPKRNKKDERGIVIRNKARLVAQGYTQEERIDYDEVFAPVARIEGIRLFLAYASFKDFMVYQKEIKSALL
ncbi:putative ribonuclease H-like domain-containing protein [Tanacetum coccineum]